jgi:hypothetical protein
MTRCLAWGFGVVEDVNRKGLLGNHKLARGLADSASDEFLCRLSYRCKGHKSELMVAKRWLPSSTT